MNEQTKLFNSKSAPGWPEMLKYRMAPPTLVTVWAAALEIVMRMLVHALLD